MTNNRPASHLALHDAKRTHLDALARSVAAEVAHRAAGAERLEELPAPPSEMIVDVTTSHADDGDVSVPFLAAVTLADGSTLDDRHPAFKVLSDAFDGCDAAVDEWAELARSVGADLSIAVDPQTFAQQKSCPRCGDDMAAGDATATDGWPTPGVCSNCANIIDRHNPHMSDNPDVCDACGPVVHGVRWPAEANGDTSRQWVERCDTCMLYSDDDAAATAVSDTTGLPIAWAYPYCSDWLTPYTVDEHVKPTRVRVEIPAVWVGLLEHGTFTDDDGHVDALGRPTPRAEGEVLDGDPLPYRDDRRVTSARADDGRTVTVELRSDEDGYWLDYGVFAADGSGLLAVTGDTVDHQVGVRNLLTAHGPVDIQVVLSFSSPNVRAAAVEAVKRAFGMSKRAAATVVDTARWFDAGSPTGARDAARIVGDVALGRLSAFSVAPLVSPMSDGQMVARAERDDDTNHRAVLHIDDVETGQGLLRVGHDDWSHGIDTDGRHVNTGLPADGGPADPTRVARTMIHAARQVTEMVEGASLRLQPWEDVSGSDHLPASEDIATLINDMWGHDADVLSQVYGDNPDVEWLWANTTWEAGPTQVTPGRTMFRLVMEDPVDGHVVGRWRVDVDNRPATDADAPWCAECDAPIRRRDTGWAHDIGGQPAGHDADPSAWLSPTNRPGQPPNGGQGSPEAHLAYALEGLLSHDRDVINDLAPGTADRWGDHDPVPRGHVELDPSRGTASFVVDVWRGVGQRRKPVGSHTVTVTRET